MKLTYRADLDGLRAIAVLSVVFYHAGIPLFSGGFVGVDVFFVISGFLITSIIIKEMEAGNFSFAGFYERRIRRIFPALLAVMIFTLIAGALLFDRPNFKNLGMSLSATSFSFANILFWRQAGYFDAPSSLKPLLHTWSLAVEEQYYIFFPVFLVLLFRHFKRHVGIIIIGSTLISLLLSIYYIYTGALSSAFYLPHLRAWELLTGSLLTLPLFPNSKKVYVSNLLGLSGIFLIGMSVFVYTKDTVFPGLTAIPPVLGSAFIIYSGINCKTLVGNWLSISPLVFIGQISYSLYLWHWPIIAFGKYYIIRIATLPEMALLLFLSFMSSIISWYFVERTFRNKTSRDHRKFFATAVSIIFLAGYIGNSIYTDKLSNAFSQIHATSISGNDNNTERVDECDIAFDDSAAASIKPCTIGPKNAKAVFLVWGDSHANVMATSIQFADQASKIAGEVLVQKGCPPLLDIKRGDVGTCLRFNRLVIRYIEDHPNIKTVFLAGRWALYAEGTRYKTEDGQNVTLTDAKTKTQETASSNTLLLKIGLERTVQEINRLGRRIIIVTQVPEVGYDVPSANFIAQKTGRNINTIIAPTRAEYLERSGNSTNIIMDLQKKYGVQILDPSQVLCNTEVCLVAIDNHALYQDSQHLSIYGSLYISSIFRQPLDELIINK